MEYIKKSIDLVLKNIILIIPLFVAAFIPALLTVFIVGAGAVNIVPQLIQLFSDPYAMSNMDVLFRTVFQIAVATTTAASFIGLISFVLNLGAQPATMGMAIKIAKGQGITTDDMVTQMKEHFMKYLKYILAFILLVIGFSIAVAIVFGIFAFIAASIEAFWIIFLLVIALFVAIVLIGVRISLWFVAMVADDMPVWAGLKRSIDVSAQAFGTILLGIVLLSLIFGIAAGVIGFFAWIPLIGQILTAGIAAFGGAVFTVFFALIYLDKTQQQREAPEEQ
ncbi:MAG: hypothetical protein ACLFR1_04335 [Spirochaetia bacterium]